MRSCRGGPLRPPAYSTQIRREGMEPLPYKHAIRLDSNPSKKSPNKNSLTASVRLFFYSSFWVGRMASVGVVTVVPTVVSVEVVAVVVVVVAVVIVVVVVGGVGGHS